MRFFAWIPLLTAGCLTDPPYRPYSAQQQQSGYGQPPPQQQGPQADPLRPTTDPNLAPPSSGYQTYQTNVNGAPQGAQPPPFVDPAAPASAQGGVVVSNTPPPPPQPQPQTTLPASAAGRYQCWVVGAGMFSQSSLGLVTLDFSNAYSSSVSAATGTYKVDGTHVLFTGGSLAGYVGALESNSNGPFVRFRTEKPSDPGPSGRIGDHVCYLAR